MRDAEKNDFSARSDPLFTRVGSKWRKARARAVCSNRQCPWTKDDAVSRLSMIAKINVNAEEEPRTCPRMGPTCLLRRDHLALLQSAAGDVLARVHLDVRHPLRRSRRWSSRGLVRRFLSSRDFTPRRALRFNVSRALRRQRNQTRRFRTRTRGEIRKDERTRSKRAAK